jgi:protein-disulfide isomerase
MKKQYLYLALGLLIGFGLGFGLGRDGGPTGGGGSDTGVPVDIAGRPYLGPADAPVTMIEFTDYQCTFCKRYFELRYPFLLEEYGDKLKYVVLHFPLSQIHPQAEVAAQAAECAGDQGKFWEYHNVLFQNNTALGRQDLFRYAELLGLDMGRFEQCLVSGEKAQVVYDNMVEAVKAGVTGTPTFFVNGRILVGAQPLAIFKAHIEQALQEAD